jgi:hypothetical protein
MSQNKEIIMKLKFGKELVNVTGDGTKAVYMFVQLAKMV